ncbi:MAG: hypothetical protein EZS28_035270 [Streblomastix strix]|uniref:Uncharacterized protein n=1 Tax=Streblomastix strix TaxID=222440 RepID=A0A5J4UG69_9EUKA|nr:MAG: hypothetical protein EZS28_035270 [Streblomastix strix]
MSKNYKDTEDVVRNIEAAKAKVHPIPAIKYKIASHSMKQRNETHKNKIEFFTDHSKLIAEYKASEQFWQNSQETIKQSFSEEIRDNDGISEEYQQLINSFKDDLDEQLSNEEEEENENKEKQQKKNEEYKPELPSYFSALLPSEEDEKLLSKKRRQENQHQTAEEFRSLWESIAQNERELQNDLADERRQLFSALRRIKEDVRGCGPETFEGRILEIKENINTFKKKLNQQKTELNKEENEAQADLDSSVIVNPRTVADMNLLFAEKFSYFNDYTPISSINALNSQRKAYHQQ